MTEAAGGIGAQLPTVTVGITSYQDAPVIRKCLESVLGQTLPADRIEVLVADDGSRDGTASVAKKYQRKAAWGRYKVLEQTYTGSPSTGRNRIIEEATGDYLFFVDADDYLGHQALETMVKTAGEDDSDIVIGRFEGVGRPAPNALPRRKQTLMNRRDRRLLHTLNVLKLFRRSFLDSVPYRFNPEARYAGDQPFMLDAYLRANRISSVTEVPCYYAVYHEGAQGARPHLTQTFRTAEQQFQFIHDSFTVLDAAREEGGDIADYATWVRQQYWNRLLRVHIPMQILRRRDTEALVSIVDEARKLVRRYGATQEDLGRESAYMMCAFQNSDAESVLAIAQMVRNGSVSIQAKMGRAREEEMQKALQDDARARMTSTR